MHTVELLAPARNVDCGMQAILCGADAVYIGAQDYSARAEAANSTEDISKLTGFAHIYGAKVYVALNTILYDNELDAARKLVEKLASVGVDALITQDTALVEMNLPLPLHASTQMDNRLPEQVRFLHENGFRRAILARELGIEDIARIHRSCPGMELEVFVHGALCVSYSGRCYASQYCFGRSANRGRCAQFCRMSFDLEDASHETLIEDRHLLSLKDMNRSDFIGELIDAGVCSLKIEGRLKDVDYVRNITAYYRQTIDKVLAHKKGYVRSSYGTSHIPFTSSPLKSFNRGYTDYFLHGRSRNIFSFNSPKSFGEPVGEVKVVYDKAVKVSGVASFSNGDGLCFVDEKGKLQGFRVNRVDNNLLFPSAMPRGLCPHMPLYRNHDEAFLRELRHKPVTRTLSVDILLKEEPQGFSLSMTDETGMHAECHFDHPRQMARTSQQDLQREYLARLGGTVFTARQIDIACSGDYFIPLSTLSQWRRQVVEELLRSHTSVNTSCQEACQEKPSREAGQEIGPVIDYTYNVSNAMARRFYQSHGAQQVDSAFELAPPETPLLMTCKYCLRHALGHCPKEHPHDGQPLREPLFLKLRNGSRFQLKFDCKNCQMLVYAAS